MEKLRILEVGFSKLLEEGWAAKRDVEKHCRHKSSPGFVTSLCSAFGSRIHHLRHSRLIHRLLNGTLCTCCRALGVKYGYFRKFMKCHGYLCNLPLMYIPLNSSPI